MVIFRFNLISIVFSVLTTLNSVPSYSFSLYPKKFKAIKNKTQIPFQSRKTIKFDAHTKTFNPSNISINNTDYLFVRVEGNDIKHINESNFYNSSIGVSKFDGGGVWGELKVLDLNTDFAEDPRAVIMNDKIFLFFNDVVNDNSKYRIMKVAVLDFNFNVEEVHSLDMQLSHYEKNWVPFVLNDNSQEIHIIYSFSPLIVFKIQHVNSEVVVSKVKQDHDSFYTDFGFWEAEWGVVRGGTPLCKIDDSTFLGIFHSSFFSKLEKKRWYVFGSYILKAKDGSFTIEKISMSPIIYKNMYSNFFSSSADKRKRVLFPTGAYIRDNRLSIFFGVNDSFIEKVEFNLSHIKKNMINTN